MAKIIVDFTDVESGGGRVRVPEGDYKGRIVGVKEAESKSGNTMLVWDIEIADGKHKGKTFKEYTVLSPQALWKLKELLECLGIRVPSKKVDLTPVIRGAKGKELGITVTDDEYEGKISSKISGYMDLETLSDFDPGNEDDDEDEDEEPQPKAKKKKKKAPVDDDEDEDEIEDLDLDSL